jgi:methionine aminotransferase
LPQLTSKLPQVGTTIFTTMSNMAAEHGAINLSQGFPDFPVPTPLVDLLTKYLKKGLNQYPPMIGVEYLRQEIMRKVHKLYGVKVDMSDEITVTSGATEALFVAIQTLVRPFDEVIVFDPAYDSYEPAITLAQGKTVHIDIDLESTASSGIDWDLVKAKINHKTRAIILNSPHNPSGRILDQSDIDSLSDIIADTDIFLISDEVYEHMVFDKQRHISLLENDFLRSRCFVISSFGKTYHATGWKVAYCISPPELTKEFRKIHQFVTFTTHTPTQWAIAEFMEYHSEHYLALPDFYQQKRDLFLEKLKESNFGLRPTAGTYFQLADYSKISDVSDVEFANYLTQKVGVAAIPISVFCDVAPHTRYVRFCFAKNDDTLIEACEKLKEI